MRDETLERRGRPQVCQQKVHTAFLRITPASSSLRLNRSIRFTNHQRNESFSDEQGPNSVWITFFEAIPRIDGSKFPKWNANPAILQISVIVLLTSRRPSHNVNFIQLKERLERYGKRPHRPQQHRKSGFRWTRQFARCLQQDAEN